MRRRTLLGLLSASAASWPMRLAGQPRDLPTVGFLSALSAAPSRYLVTAFQQGLRETGFVEGQSVRIEFRWAEHRYDQLPGMAADLVRRGVAVIAATGGVPSAQAAKAATTAIPVVFTIGDDPVRHGLTRSFNDPGGNVTGVTLLAVALDPKRLELVRELSPAASMVGMIMGQ